MKSYLKWLVALVGLVCIIVLFQNCSKKNTKASDVSATLYETDAQQLIGLMESAGIKDNGKSTGLSTSIQSLRAESMTCKRFIAGNGQECSFKVKKEDGSYKINKTTSQASLAMVQFLFGIGVKNSCTTDCNDVESYSVTSVVCDKNFEFSSQSTCTFNK